MTRIPASVIRAVLITASLLLLITGESSTGLAQIHVTAQQIDPAQSQSEGTWVVRAYYRDPQQVRELASRVEPWEVHLDESYVVVEVDADLYRWMESADFRLEIDPELTLLVRAPPTMLPGQESGIPGYPCYRTVEETYASAESIATTYPNIAEWIDIGDSWEKVTPGGNPGYDLKMLKMTSQKYSGPKPGLFVMSSMHAREYAPAEMNMRFAEYLATNYDIDPDVTWLLDHHTIYLLFHANPDGRKRAESGLGWRKNTNNLFCSNTNSRGVDLNRNFNFAWGCCSGSSGNQCDETYRGPGPGTEPETQAIQNFVRSQFADQRDDDLIAPAPVETSGVFLDLHSYGELILWPWGFTTQPAPNRPALRRLGRRMAYFNGYNPDSSYTLYPTDGTSDDFAYGELGLAAYTIELGTQFFQSCNGFESNVYPYNLPALLYAARVARTPYLLPYGPDVTGLQNLPVVATPGTSVQLSASIDDTRYNNSNGVEPVQNILAAEYYIDTPPWSTDPLPTAYPMLPIDGTFDSPREDASAIIDTVGMGTGRHIAYIRGQDASGYWGPVSAVFLTVREASSGDVLYLPFISRQNP